MSGEDGRVTLAFQDLEVIPDQVADQKGATATELDLTENAIK